MTSEKDWAVIAVGKSVIAENDVSAVHDFSAAGPGTFTFDPVSRFQVAGLDDVVEANIAHSVSITVTGDDPKRELDLEKRAIYQCSDEDKHKDITAAYVSVRFLAVTVAAYIRKNGPDNLIYKRYFGTSGALNVVHQFDALVDEKSPTPMTCPGVVPGCSTLGLVFSDKGNINFCDQFFGLQSRDAFCGNPNDISTNMVGLTFVTFARVFTSAGGDIASCVGSMALPDPEKVTNAHNYACFAAEVYKATKCQ